MKLFGTFLSRIIMTITIFPGFSLAQEMRPVVERDFQIIDQFINREDIEVFLVKNSEVDSRSRSCSKLYSTSKGAGYYKTNRGEVIATASELIVIQGASKLKIIRDEHGRKSCLKGYNVRSIKPEAFSKNNIPFIISYQLAEDVCYIKSYSHDCSMKCIAMANAGSPFHYIVIGEQAAMSISKTSCQD